MIQIPVVEAGDAFGEGDAMVPAEGVEFGHIGEFAHCAVGFGGVPDDFAPEADGRLDQRGQIPARTSSSKAGISSGSPAKPPPASG